MGTLEEDLQRELTATAVRLGLRVQAHGVHDEHGRLWPVLKIEANDNAQAITFLQAASILDAARPEVKSWAFSIRRALAEAGRTSPESFARGVHEFVRSWVRFIHEEDEEFRNAALTLEWRYGDCDDFARVTVALLTAGGERAQCVAVKNAKGAITHVAPQWWDSSRGIWVWLEGTVDAMFGEEPIAAARRLHLDKRRTDITGGEPDRFLGLQQPRRGA